MTHTETAGLRAPSQASLWLGLSTLHQIFTPPATRQPRAERLRQPLLCCFLHLKGACNRVLRAFLWQALARIGAPGTLLAATQSLCGTPEYAISVGGRRGAGVQSACGVKQGCPLSPTPFGLLLDGLRWALLAHAPGAGPPLACGRRVPDLGCADYFCVLAASAANLQRLLDTAYTFLTSVGVELSLDKSRATAFSAACAAAAVGAAWTCGGVRSIASVLASHSLPRRASLRPSRPWVAGCVAAGRNWNSALARCMMGFLCSICVLCFGRPFPAGLYACEVWGVGVLCSPPKSHRERLAQALMQLWRRLPQVHSKVAEEVVLRDLGVCVPATCPGTDS